MRRGILSAALGLALVAAAAPAMAQTTTTNYQPGCTNATVNLGTVVAPGSLSGTIGPNCHFTGTVVMAVNGAAAGTKLPNTGNGVNVSLQAFAGGTSGLLNDPVAVPLHVGGNSVTATGPTNSGPQTVTGTFTVLVPGAAAGAAAAPSSRVAFTGANILRWSLAASALLGIGVLMVWFSRRRRPTL